MLYLHPVSSCNPPATRWCVSRCKWEQMQELSGLKEPSFKGKPGVPSPGMSWRPPHFVPHPRSCLFNYSDLTVSQAALPSFVRATYGAHAFDSSSGPRLSGTSPSCRPKGDPERVRHRRVKSAAHGLR